MEKLYRRFAEWVTRWRISNKIDQFFEARVGLTLYYVTTAIIILGGSSIITYNAILTNLTESVLDRRFDPVITQLILSDAKSILFNRFLTIDSLIIVSTVIIGFLLTNKTLKPIRTNMLKQKRFIADASHELRTPTAVIISGLEVALNNKKLDFVSAKKTLENTLDEMRELAELSNNLLDISKYDMPSFNIKYEEIRIDEKIERIVEKSRILAKIKKIEIKTKMESPATILGNRIELARVFYNILDNAIKYTPYEGKISVSGEIDLHRYLMTFSDTGSGIPKDSLEKIFEPFFRGDASRNTGGAGLGLSLSKKIIENHKGTIFLKSELDKGTTVTISLPLSS